jgi:hypothetical protein
MLSNVSVAFDDTGPNAAPVEDGDLSGGAGRQWQLLVALLKLLLRPVALGELQLRLVAEQLA